MQMEIATTASQEETEQHSLPRRIAGQLADINRWLLFGVMSVLLVLEALIANRFILTNEVYYQSFAGRASIESVEKIIASQRGFEWVIYLVLPLVLLVKVAFPALCITIGFYLAGRKLSFKRLFGIALVAEIFLVVNDMLQLAWLMLQGVKTLREFELFSPFSLFSLFDPATLPAWSVPLLRGIGLTDLAYCAIWGVGLCWALRERFTPMFRMTLASYGTGLIFYLLARTFIQLAAGA